MSRCLALLLAFVALAGLSVYAIAYVGDRAINPWPGVR